MSRLIHIVIILLSLSAAYVLWLDQRVQSEFTGARWSLPARVYADPVELYPGQQLSLDRVEQLLLGSGYRKTPAPVQAGDYRRSGTGIEFIRREFHYWDGIRDSRRLRLEVRNREIAQILDLSAGQTLPLVRIEPELIGKIFPGNYEDRILVGYHELPAALIRGLLAVEDRDYFNHYGLEPRSILRAALHNLMAGELEQGGSTITQQLVKNFFLTRERSITRKVNEAIMALLLERRYSKQDILGAYVNEVYLGQQGQRSVHGFGAAAEFYFARPLDELRLDQLALLVGMVKGASWYNPRRHVERAQQRRNLILDLMHQQGYIEAQEWRRARAQPLDLSARPRWVSGKYPAFLQLVKQQLSRDYAAGDLRSKGLRIFTTLDTRRQDHIEQVLREQLPLLERNGALHPGSLQAASVFVETSTGAVLALAGGRDAQYVGFNRALQAQRPIGSLVKPFVYYTALAQPQRYSLASMLDDSDVSVTMADGSSWSPDNFDGRNHGRVSLPEAMARSYNKATVRLGRQLGEEQVAATLHKAGVDKDIKPFPALLLGALELTPLQVAQIYQTLANGGFLAPVNTIREVLDRRGEAVQRYGLEVRRALHAEPAYLSAYLMVQAVNRGTGRNLRRIIPERLPLAGKTGTSNDLRDSWFAGFGDDVAGVVWLGHDDNHPIGLTGASGALRLWGNMVKGQDLRRIELLPPPGVGTLEGARLPFAGACVSFPHLPYILGFKPELPAC